jgi:hypothetical protein
MAINLRKIGTSIWEALTPQNEEELRANQRSIEAARQKLSTSPGRYGVLADPNRRQQYINELGNQPQFSLAKALGESAVSSGIGVRDFAVDVLRDTAKIPERTLRSVTQPLVSAIDPTASASQQGTNTGVRKFLYGEEPVQTVFDEIKQMQEGAKQSESPFVRDVIGESPAISIVGPALFGGLDVVPGGKPVKTAITKGAKEALPTVTKKSADEITGELIQASDTAKDLNKGPLLDRTRSTVTRHVADPLNEFQRSDRQLAKKAGVNYRDLPAEKSLTKLYNDLQNADSILKAQSEDVLEAGLSLRGVIQKYPRGDKMKKFLNYTALRSDLENLQKGGTRLTNLSEVELAQAIRGFEAANPTAALDAKTIKLFKDRMEREAVETGLLRPEDADTAIKSREFYFPGGRAESDELIRGRMVGGMRGSTGQQKVLQARKGGDEPLDYSWESVLSTFSRDKKQNLQTRMYREMYERADQGTIGAKVINRPEVAARRRQAGELHKGLVEEQKKLISLKRKKTSDKRVAGLLKKEKEFSAAKQARRELTGMVDDVDAKAAISGLSNKELLQVFDTLADAKPGKYKALRESLSKRSAAHAKLADEIGKLSGKIDETAGQKRALFAERVELAPDKALNLDKYSGYIGGEKTTLQLERNVAKMMQGLSPSGAKDVVTAVTNVPVRAAKAMFTGVLNPVFAALNLVKNPVLMVHNAGIGSVGVRPIISGVLGMFNAGKFGSKNLRRFGINEIRATQGVSVPKVRAEIMATNRRSAKSLAEFTINNPWLTVKEVVNSLDRVFAATDRVFRSATARATYIRAKRKGFSEEQAMNKAAQTYNEAMGNFNRVTEAARAAEPLILYSGAIQTGARSFARAYKDRPFQTLATDAALVGGAALLVNANMNNEAGREFYNDMLASDKEYELDNNIIIVRPDAHKDEKTGKWKNVYKIPINPDMRPLNRMAWRATAGIEGEQPNPLDILGHFTGDMPKTLNPKELVQNNPQLSNFFVLANRDPRTGEQIVSDHEQTLPLEEQIDKDYTSETAKGLSKWIRLSPKQIDSLLNNFGLSGDVLQNKSGNPLSTIRDSFLRQFGKELKGDSKGAKFYDDLTAVSNTFKNEADFKAFELLHTKNKDKTIDSPASRAKMLLAMPEVLRAEAELDKLSRKRGEVGNPFYDLKPEQQQKVLRYRASKDLNAAKQAYDKNGNPLFTSLGLDEKWYDDFRGEESDFFDKIKGEDDGENRAASTYSGAKKPKAVAELQKKLDHYFTLPKGTGARSAFLDQNPDVLEHWAKSNQFTNAERLALGLKISDDAMFEGGSFGSSGFGGGGGGTRSAGSAFKYAIPLNIAGEAVKPKVSVKKGGSKAKVAKQTSLPKVSLKKSKV